MFCKQCGNRLEDGAKFCNGCGAAVENNAPQANYQPAGQASTSNSNAKIYKILAYIGILFLVGLLANKENDKSVRFHVGQGIVLCIAGVAASIVYSIISAIAFALFLDPFGSLNVVGVLLTSVLGLAISGCTLALAIIGIVHAANGEDKELPVIGKYAFYK